MAPNQKTTQPRRSKTTLFLACFGFSPKTSSSSKKKPKKIDARKKFFKLKLCWPKLKLITIKKKKKKYIYDAKAAALATSDDIMFEATKVHQLKLIDHHALNIKESSQLKVPSSEGSIPKDDQNRPNKSHCATCHRKDPVTSKAVVKRSFLADKVSRDSLIGVAMMVALLTIMSIWGRLCAILCVSAWLYCVPLFHGNRDVTVAPNHASTKLGADALSAELCKKKVVLQGFIQRDDKTAIGIS